MLVRSGTQGTLHLNTLYSNPLIKIITTMIVLFFEELVNKV